MRSLAFGKVGGCIVFACGKRPFEDSEWASYVQFLSREFVPGTRPVCLVYAERAGPTADQRQLVNDVIKPVAKELKAAVMTTNHLVRGIVTAMSWFSPVYQAFTPSQLDEAIAFLGVRDAEIPAVKQLLAELKAQITTS